MLNGAMTGAGQRGDEDSAHRLRRRHAAHDGRPGPGGDRASGCSGSCGRKKATERAAAVGGGHGMRPGMLSPRGLPAADHPARGHRTHAGAPHTGRPPPLPRQMNVSTMHREVQTGLSQGLASD